MIITVNVASRQTSTIVDTSEIQYTPYASIFSEADIFSDLPKEIFNGKDEMSVTLNLFRNVFYDRVSLYKEVIVLPKFKYVVEGDEKLIQLSLPWNNGNATIYFSFDENSKHNFVGYSMNDTINNEFSSNTRDINDSNRFQIISSIIDLIFKMG